MLLHDSRRDARFRDGELVLLADQDRSLWDRDQIAQGRAALDRAVRPRTGAGPTWCRRRSRRCTSQEPPDWAHIAVLYGELFRLTGSPVVELNRAVAVAEVEGPEAGLDLIDGSARRSTTTDTCTRPRAELLGRGSGASTRPAARTGGRWSSSTTTRSGGCSNAASPSWPRTERARRRRTRVSSGGRVRVAPAGWVQLLGKSSSLRRVRLRSARSRRALGLRARSGWRGSSGGTRSRLPVPLTSFQRLWVFSR